MLSAARGRASPGAIFSRTAHRSPRPRAWIAAAITTLPETQPIPLLLVHRSARTKRGQLQTGQAKSLLARDLAGGRGFCLVDDTKCSPVRAEFVFCACLTPVQSLTKLNR